MGRGGSTTRLARGVLYKLSIYMCLDPGMVSLKRMNAATGRRVREGGTIPPITRNGSSLVGERGVQRAER